MNNLSITLQIPSLGDAYDFTIPADMPIRGVQYLVVKILHSRYGVSGDRTGLQLFDKSDGKLLDQDCSLSELGLSDGATLVLL